SSDLVLSAMLKTYTGISDLNFSVGHPLQVEDFGELKPVYVDPPIEALTPHQTEQVALTVMQGNRRLLYDYLTGGSCDCSYSLDGEARFRVNIFRQQGHFSVVLRKLQSNVQSARARTRLQQLSHWITRRSSSGAESDSRRRNARPRHRRNRDDGSRDRTFGFKHAAYGRCRPIDQSYPRFVFVRRRTTAASSFGGFTSLHRQ